VGYDRKREMQQDSKALGLSNQKDEFAVYRDGITMGRSSLGGKIRGLFWDIVTLG
jgi:hypothetical protein